MVIGNYQEAEFNNASCKSNTKEEKFFTFLVSGFAYFKNKEGIIFVFL
jgi:hypothetical protein